MKTKAQLRNISRYKNSVHYSFQCDQGVRLEIDESYIPFDPDYGEYEELVYNVDEFTTLLDYLNFPYQIKTYYQVPVNRHLAGMVDAVDAMVENVTAEEYYKFVNEGIRPHKYFTSEVFDRGIAHNRTTRELYYEGKSDSSINEEENINPRPMGDWGFETPLEHHGPSMYSYIVKVIEYDRLEFKKQYYRKKMITLDITVDENTNEASLITNSQNQPESLQP